jgi:formylglycine-generating enzyme required for sulfatase activity
MTETGGTYRLPSEAQWEKAARGTQGQLYPWGDKWDSENSPCNLHQRRTTPVKHFPEGVSPYGCFDMVGNLREWTRTLWGYNSNEPDPNYRYPRNKDEHNDDDGIANDEIRRVYRGRGEPWDTGPLRTSIRGSQLPKEAGEVDARFGFRVVLEMDNA